MNRDDLLMINGVDNDESGIPNDDINVPLFNHVYNGISVGVIDGSHMNDTTPAGIDGTGRMLHVIVAPGSKTSWAIPVAAAGAALMVEPARTTPALWGQPGRRTRRGHQGDPARRREPPRGSSSPGTGRCRVHSTTPTGPLRIST